MRILLSTTLLALVCSIHVYSDVHSAEHVLRQVCCPGVFTHNFVDKRVTHVAFTSRCQKAIVVKNVCNKTFCVDANLTSAQNLLHRFTTAKANMTTKSPFGRECKDDQCLKRYRCRP